MSDFNSSNPIRTEHNGDAVIFVADGTTSSQLLAIDSAGRVTIKLDDGAGNSVTSQNNGAQRALDVGINVAGVQIDPRSIRALTSADVVSVVQSTSPWVVSDLADGSIAPGAAGTKSSLGGAVYTSAGITLTTGQQAALQSDVNGNLKVNLATALPTGANTIGAVTQASGPWTQNLTQVGGSAIALGQTTMSASVPVTFASNQSALAVTQSTSPWVVSGTVTANQGTANATPWNENVAQFGGNAVVTGTGASGVGIPRVTVSNDSSVLANIQVAGSAVSATNPVPVTLSTSSPGTAIQNYQTSVALASGSSVTLTYTIPATHTFNLEGVWATASGKIKAVFQNNGTTILVGFNSTATPIINYTVVSPPTVVAGNTVSVIITNEDKAAFDVYAGFLGNLN